jgi:hypothetical protein
VPELSHDIDDAAHGNGVWRLAAVVGVLAALVIAASDSFPFQPRQGRLFLFAAGVAFVAWSVLHFVFPGPWRQCRRQLDLLVPIGIVAGVEQLLAVLARMPLLSSILEPDWSLRLVSLSLSVSVGTVANVIVWTAFAAWQTDLLWRALQDNGPLRLAPWRPIRRHFLRSLAALSLGVGVLLLALIPILAIGAVMFVVAIPLILVLGIVWNLATAALLPTTLFKSAPLAESLKSGLHLSWRWKGRWWRGLFAQLLLLGLFVLLRVHYTTSSTEYGPGPGQGRTTVNTVSSVKWHTNAFWVGGYEHGCRWYTKYAEALNAPTVPLISQVLALILLVVADAMKMTVIRELVEDSEFSMAAKPSPLLQDPETGASAGEQ